MTFSVKIIPDNKEKAHGHKRTKLTKEQHEWLNGWLELWGAWVYSGRLEKRMSSVIAKFMESVEPGRIMTRPMCNDDDGMLISQVVDSVMYIDKKAFDILLSYYAHGSSKHAIASYYHRVARPRKMLCRGGGRIQNHRSQPVAGKLTKSSMPRCL